MHSQQKLSWVKDALGERLVHPGWHAEGVPHGFFGRAFDAKAPDGNWKSRFPVPMYMLEQVHGDAIADGSNPAYQKADAWIIDSADSQQANALYGIITADCTPVLVRCSKSKVLGAAHCGWRSALANLLEKLLQAMKEKGAEARTMELAIGPAAQTCCYEVGDEVIYKVLENCPEAEKHGILHTRKGKTYCEISRLIKYQAIRFGLDEAQVAQTDSCTICDESFFSYRRENVQAGRQLTFLGSLLHEK